MAQTVSGSDFNNSSLVGAYNGTYSPSSGGVMQLSYGSIAAPVDDDAVVGMKGPLGTLGSLNMSFNYSNPVGTGAAPFAAFGVSTDNTWGGANNFNIISLNGNQLTGTSLVHVWDWNLNGGAGGDVAGLNGVTLNSILGVNNSFNGVAFGNLQVMRAYAYIGDTGGPSYGSVDINSITVTAVPEPETYAMLLAGLGLVGAFVRRRKNTPI
jgi:hypothetical protein